MRVFILWYIQDVYIIKKFYFKIKNSKKDFDFITFVYTKNMKKILPFVAIDLETTGLDPSTDTIIEISAIAFDVCLENNYFSLENIQERSMLIDPEIPLSEEVTLITHITGQMLEGKPKWRDIQEKVANFL